MFAIGSPFHLLLKPRVDDVFSPAQIPDAVPGGDRLQAVHEGPADPFERFPAGKFLKRNDIPEARMVRLAAGMGGMGPDPDNYVLRI